MPKILRVTWSPTGMLTASTWAASSIQSPWVLDLLPLITQQSDQSVDQHHRLEQGQPADDAPPDRLVDNQQTERDPCAHPETQYHTSGEGLPIDHAFFGHEPHR